MTIQSYPYSKDTGEYLGRSLPAQICSFDNTVIHTVYSSLVQPLATEANQVAVMLDSNGAVPDDSRGLEWTVLPDFRGTVYWLPNSDSRQVVDQLGVPLPEGALLEEPPASPAQLAAKRRLEILQELSRLDTKKIRAISDALLNGDSSFLQSVETSQEALRVELRTLPT